MRFDVRTLVSPFLSVATTVLTVFLSGPVAGQNTVTPATPPASTALGATGLAPAGAAPAAATVEGSSKELLEKGNAALKAGDYQAAVTAFKAALGASDQATGSEGLRDRLTAVVGKCRALAGLKEYKAALNDLGAIISDDPNSPNAVPAMVARGQILLDQNRTDDALVDFEKAVELDSANAEAQFGLGKALVYTNKVDDAILPLTHAIDADPNNGEAYRLRGVANSALFKTKQAVEDLEQAIKVNPDDYEAYFSLGAVKFRSEDYRAAVDQFGAAIEHYKPKPGQEDVPYVQGYISRSAAYLELGKAEKNNPAARQAAYKAAFDEAQKIAAQLDPKNPLHVKALSEVLSKRGIAERMLGQLGTAVRTLTQAIELRATSPPDDNTSSFLSDAYFRRGVCFHLIGEDRMAISDFETSAHLVTEDPRADLWEGFTYAKLGDYHKALRAYGDAIAASDRYTYAYYNRGLTYMMLGDYNKAVADFNDAIRLDPVNAEYYFKRGIAYQQLGDNQKASESFAAALEFDNKHAGAYRHMADVMQALGRTELVTQYRQKADQLAPPKKSK